MSNETSFGQSGFRVVADIKDGVFAAAAGVETLLVDAAGNLNKAILAENQLAHDLHEMADQKELLEGSLLLLEMNKGKDGKINGPNEAVRKLQAADFLMYKKMDKGEYQDICADLDAATTQYQAAKVELAQRQNEYDVYRALSALYTAKLRALQPS